MTESFWQKIKKNHLLLIVLCCLLPIVLIIGFLAFFKGSNYWVWLIVLLCPLLHIWMMRGDKHSEHIINDGDKLYKCSECGFEYKEKEWAEKCGAWCKEHRSCNLEIIKHAIKRLG